MKLFIYAFEKFDKLNSNTSEEVGKLIFDKINGKRGIEIRFEVFGVSYDFKDNLEKSINEFKPDLILGLGAAKRNKVSVESVALNVIHEPKGDEKGTVLINKKITNGADALKTDFDCEGLVYYLKKKEIPTELSFHAGTYICNNSYYNCLKYIKDNSLKTDCVFVHVPLSPKEVNILGIDAPSFPPYLIAEALISFLQSYKK